MQNWKRLLGEMHAMEYVTDTKAVLHDVEEEEKIVSLVTTVRNWLLHLVSSAHLLALCSTFSKV
jgi:hypothetical protein